MGDTFTIHNSGGALVTSDGNPEGKDATWVHAHLGDYLLGYDLDPESFKGLRR